MKNINKTLHKLFEDEKFNTLLKENPKLLETKEALETLQKACKESEKRDSSPKRNSKTKEKGETVCFCADLVVNRRKRFCQHCLTWVCKHCFCELVTDYIELNSCVKCMKLSADPVPRKYGRPKSCGKLYYKAYLKQQKEDEAPVEEDCRDY